MARPTKLTPGAREAILVALRTGNTETTAAAYAGISYESYRLWKRRDLEFLAAIEKAQADAQAEAVARVRSAMPEHWQAAAWWLERRLPKDWGRVDRLQLLLSQEAADVAEALGLDKALAVAETERLLREARARGRE